MTATCAYCGGTVPPSKVTLWNGKDYCSACLEDVVPGLFQYATEHPVFEDIWPGNMSRHEWPKGRLFTISGLLLFGIASASCILFQAPTADQLPYLAGVIALLTMFLYLVLSPMLDLMVHSESTTIRIALVAGSVTAQAQGLPEATGATGEPAMERSKEPDNKLMSEASFANGYEIRFSMANCIKATVFDDEQLFQGLMNGGLAEKPLPGSRKPGNQPEVSKEAGRTSQAMQFRKAEF